MAMAKTQALEWGAFMRGEVLEKKVEKVMAQLPVKAIAVGGALTIVSACFDGGSAMAAAFAPLGGGEVGKVMATVDFADQLRKATQPIRDVIFAFGHEIYFVMMAWGGIEALIGKTQQGFSRMKASTAAYVILYWVPWIVGTVNQAVPH